MKYYELKAIVDRLKEFKYITKARRVEDNTIELIFDRDSSYFFNMTRGNSFVYKSDSIRPLQGYKAPFDNLLHSLVSASKIIDIEIPNQDRVIRFHLSPKSSYKDKSIYLQFEFTGRYTNAILIDENEYVIEALRHIDSNSSFRVIRPAVKLLPIPPIKSEPKIEEIENKSTEKLGTDGFSLAIFGTLVPCTLFEKVSDSKEFQKNFNIDDYLSQKYIEFEKKRVAGLKKQKLLQVQKKQQKLQKLLDKLPNPEELAKEEKKYQNYANIILANLYQIKPYDKKLKTYDFEGNEITIPLPKGVVPNRMSEYYFNLAKKMRAKAKNIHIEKENLSSKIKFYANSYYAIENAKDTHELELLLPKRGKSQRKKAKIKECEMFWIDDYKVLIGRNSKENQALLKMAKSNDIWMHIRDIPSSHLIIKTDKQNVPDSLIQKCAKLCVDFSLTQAGDYAVDYCKRKFVKIQEGSRVEYDKYKTIHVRKDGIEIRE